jgi:hypothetical protein
MVLSFLLKYTLICLIFILIDWSLSPHSSLLKFQAKKSPTLGKAGPIKHKIRGESGQIKNLSKYII